MSCRHYYSYIVEDVMPKKPEERYSMRWGLGRVDVARVVPSRTMSNELLAFRGR